MEKETDTLKSEDTMSFLEDEAAPFDIVIHVNASANAMFARLGIEFGPFAEGETMRKARLPKGWRIEKVNKKSSAIIDNNEAKRAELVQDGVRTTVLNVMPRFITDIDNTIVDANVRARFCVWDQKRSVDERVVFEVSYPVPNKVRNSAAHERTIKFHAERQECQKWLEENYPDWKDPLAYWDEE